MTVPMEKGKRTSWDKRVKADHCHSPAEVWNLWFMAVDITSVLSAEFG